MKRANKRKAAIALALATVPLLMGCGSNKSNSGVGGVPGSIAAGTCVPITQQIPFTGSNIYFDWANIRGGAIPRGQTFGQMVVGGTLAGGQYQRSGVDGTISMNIVQANQAVPTNGSYPYYPTNNGSSQLASATGFVTISSATQQDIMFRFSGTGGAYPTPYPTYPGTTPMPTAPQSVPCVSGIAMDVGHYYNTIYGGNVYLYLNNTQNGYALYF